jgi:Lrp/AsnC family transcriptional regulator for asnA, asnC and gidA
MAHGPRVLPGPAVVLDGISKRIIEQLQQDGDGDLEKVSDQLADIEEIDYVVITAGSFDLLLEVVCEDDDHLLEILSRIRSVPSVTSTETFVYLKLRKQTYSWGTR